MSQYLPNEELERILASGDEQAIADALYLLARNVVATYSRYAPPGFDTEDAVQDCVLQAWRVLPRIDTTKGKPFTYLTQAMRWTLSQTRRSGWSYVCKFKQMTEFDQ